jgi:spore coat polysaccharide biosynthesis predicted glycosyltransferase SpsG
VVDGYHFTGEYQKAVKQEGLSLLVVDDFGHAEHYWADVVLNQDMNAEECLYRSREPYTRLLLGPEYVCLRREFRRLPRVPRQSNGAACKLLVTLGGSDPGNVSELVIQSLD